MKNSNYTKIMRDIQSLIKKEDWSTAWQQLCLADRQFPETPAVLTAMGDCQIHMDKPEAAIPFFQKVIDLEPTSIEAMNNLGVAYMFVGDFHNAETTYLEALQYKPDHAQTLKNLAFLYYQQADRLGDAAQILASVIRSNPQDCESIFLMGQCYEMGGDLASAQKCYERVLFFQPDFELAKDALKHLNK